MPSNTHSERIAALYQAEADHLLNVVNRNISGTDRALVEDACAFAWAQLVRRPDVDPADPRTLTWLIVVATHEGWRLARRQTAGHQDFEFDAPALTGVEDSAEARGALGLIARLPGRQRQIAALAASGLSREEIAETTGDTLRTVDRQLYRARAKLRELRGVP